MHDQLHAWLIGNESSRVSLEWLWFETAYGFAPPSDFQSFVECCGYGQLGSQWDIGVAVPKLAVLDEVEECRISSSLLDWTDTSEALAEPAPQEASLMHFLSQVKNSKPFTFACDSANNSRFAAWRRMSDSPERWDVVIIDFANLNIERVASSFKMFVAKWIERQMRSELYDLEDDESPSNWRPSDLEALQGRIAEAIGSLSM